jgi:hypothetical protein
MYNPPHLRIVQYIGTTTDALQCSYLKSHELYQFALPTTSIFKHDTPADCQREFDCVRSAAVLKSFICSQIKFIQDTSRIIDVRDLSYRVFLFQQVVAVQHINYSGHVPLFQVASFGQYNKKYLKLFTKFDWIVPDIPSRHHLWYPAVYPAGTEFEIINAYANISMMGVSYDEVAETLALISTQENCSVSISAPHDMKQTWNRIKDQIRDLLWISPNQYDPASHEYWAKFENDVAHSMRHYLADISNAGGDTTDKTYVMQVLRTKYGFKKTYLEHIVNKYRPNPCFVRDRKNSNSLLYEKNAYLMESLFHTMKSTCTKTTLSVMIIHKRIALYFSLSQTSIIKWRTNSSKDVHILQKPYN